MTKTWTLLLLASLEPAAHARSLTLSEAVMQAFRVDPTLQQSQIARDRGKLDVLRSQLDRVSVRIDGQLQELWNKTNIGGPQLVACDAAGNCAPAPDQSPSAGQGNFNLTADVRVPIFSGLRVESNVARAQRERDAAVAGVHQSQRDIALAVARAYWSVRRLDLVRRVQLEALARLREGEQVVTARVKVGLAPPIDHNRATLRRLQQEAALADLEGQLNEATAQLGVALGLGDEQLVLTDEPNFPSANLAGDLVAQALRARPELKGARLQLEAQHQIVRMAKSTYYPQLSAVMLFQYGNNPFVVGSAARIPSETANPFSNLAANLTVGGTLSMNFFNMLNTYTDIKDARYEEVRRAEEVRRVERALENEVRTAKARWSRLQSRHAALVASNEVARDNLTILQSRYKNGDALVIEFLDAQVDRTNSEQQLTDVTAQLQLAWLELEASLGKTVGVQ